jgi:hypothetical protein
MSGLLVRLSSWRDQDGSLIRSAGHGRSGIDPFEPARSTIVPEVHVRDTSRFLAEQMTDPRYRTLLSAHGPTGSFRAFSRRFDRVGHEVAMGGGMLHNARWAKKFEPVATLSASRMKPMSAS